MPEAEPQAMQPAPEAVWEDGAQSAGILHGLRVLDLSRILAGPYCAQMLADHGASVIKVEGPAGDDTRHWGPPFDLDGVSAYFYGLNRNKRNVSLDLSTDAGVAVASQLIAQADVVVENFKPGTMAGWGLGYEEVLAEQHPRLVYCRISGFGTDGPMGGLPGYDAVLQAFGGLMSINGYPDRGPLRVGVPIVDLMTANLAFSGILLALHERNASGRGQLVDVSLLDAAISLLHPHSAAWAVDGKPPERTGEAHPTVAPYQTFPTRFGHFLVGAANDRQFAALMRVLGRPEVVEDPRFVSNAARIVHVRELEALLVELIDRWEVRELATQLIAAGVPAAPVNDVGAALRDPQVRHRGLFVETEDYRGVGVPLSFSRSRTRQPTARLERGSDSVSVLRGLGYSADEIGELQHRGALSS